ncbi:unnamed protein product [Mytilus edulis]|uniref:Uncharacterized protein n=1 Tax=Mytilus edulis TaxID=6550 RepID=A0A8S3QKY8_MYTED|nr:unnamed protein product [Mytilus edulis]
MVLIKQTMKETETPGQSELNEIKEALNKQVSDIRESSIREKTLLYMGLGKKKESDDDLGYIKPRPLKIIWADNESKRTFMKQLSYLKGIDEESPFYGISVTHDMTKEERDENRKKIWKLRLKLKVISRGKTSICDIKQAPEIIMVTEVLPKNSRYNLNKAEFSFSDYDMFRDNFSSESGRGIIIYLKRELKAVEVNIESEFKEHVWVKINLKDNDEAGD